MQMLRGRGLSALVAIVCAFVFTAPSNGQGCTTCAIDFNFNGARDVGDLQIFLSIWPSSCCDINADGVVTNADVTTFVTYYNAPFCPCWTDYNGDYVIDILDLLLFLPLYSAGSCLSLIHI